MRMLIALLTVSCVAALGVPALADFDPNEDHPKMHFPQYPDEDGWDVKDDMDPICLADDFKCTCSAPIDDIHFWGSWKGGITGTINSFDVRIYSNVPADPNDPNSFSHPGERLWPDPNTPPITDFTANPVVPIDPNAMEGWYDPATPLVIPNDHNNYWAYNIEQITDPFVQEEGTIYWLFICADVADPNTEWGWKTADVTSYPAPHTGQHYEDDAVWTIDAITWEPIHDPDDPNVSLDLAFVITTTEPCIPTVSEWGLIVMTLLLLTAATVVIGRRRRPVLA